MGHTPQTLSDEKNQISFDELCVWLPLSRLLPKCKAMEWIKGFLIKLFVRIECIYQCSHFDFKFMYIHKWTVHAMCPSGTHFLYLYLAQVNAGISILYCRSKIKESLSDFLTCSSADFPACNLRTIQIRRKCVRRRTHCVDCPFLNEYKQSKKSKCEH